MILIKKHKKRKKRPKLKENLKNLIKLGICVHKHKKIDF